MEYFASLYYVPKRIIFSIKILLLLFFRDDNDTYLLQFYFGKEREVFTFFLLNERWIMLSILALINKQQVLTIENFSIVYKNKYQEMLLDWYK